MKDYTTKHDVMCCVFNTFPLEEIGNVVIRLVNQETRITSMRQHNLIRLEYYDIKQDKLIPLYTFRRKHEEILATHIKVNNITFHETEKNFLLLYECPVEPLLSDTVMLHLVLNRLSLESYQLPKEVIALIIQYINSPPYFHVCKLIASLYPGSDIFIENLYLILQIRQTIQIMENSYPKPLTPPTPGRLD